MKTPMGKKSCLKSCSFMPSRSRRPKVFLDLPHSKKSWDGYPRWWRLSWRRPNLTALSRCRTIDASDLVDDVTHAAAAAARHVSMAEARKVRCVLAETRWR